MQLGPERCTLQLHLAPERRDKEGSTKKEEKQAQRERKREKERHRDHCLPTTYWACTGAASCQAPQRTEKREEENTEEGRGEREQAGFRVFVFKPGV